MQPSFHRPRTVAFVDNVTEETSSMLDRWRVSYRAEEAVSIIPEIGRPERANHFGVCLMTISEEGRVVDGLDDPVPFPSLTGSTSAVSPRTSPSAQASPSAWARTFPGWSWTRRSAACLGSCPGCAWPCQGRNSSTSRT
jgi:hypothetical protein